MHSSSKILAKHTTKPSLIFSWTNSENVKKKIETKQIPGNMWSDEETKKYRMNHSFANIQSKEEVKFYLISDNLYMVEGKRISKYRTID